MKTCESSHDSAAHPGADRSSGLDAAEAVAVLQAVSAEIVPAGVVRAVVTSAVRYLRATRAVLAVSHDASGTLATAAEAREDGIDVSTSGVLPVDAEVASLVDLVSQGRKTVGVDADRSPPLPSGDDVAACRRVAAPLLRGERLLAVLVLEFAASSAGYSDRLALIELLVSQAAVSLDHALATSVRGTRTGTAGVPPPKTDASRPPSRKARRGSA